MKREWFLLLFTSFVLALFVSCGGVPVIDEIRKDGVVYIGTVPFEPPLLYQLGGGQLELVGADAKLAKKIVGQIGQVIGQEGHPSKVDLKWVMRSYPTLLSALENEEVHFLVGALGITEARKERVLFSDPYYTSELGLVINPMHKDVKADSLTGQRIGVRGGTAVEQVIKTKFADSRTMTFETLNDAVLALRRAEIDAVVDDRSMAAFALDTVPGASYLELVPKTTLASIDYGVALRKGDESLRQIINEVIAEIKAGDLYTKWVTEHIGDRLEKVKKRYPERLERQRTATEPRRVTIRISKDNNYNFDIYRMANLRFTLTNQDSGQSYRSSRINFRQRVGVSRATTPPGNYMLLLPKFKFRALVSITSEDGDEVVINIRLRSGGIIVEKG